MHYQICWAQIKEIVTKFIKEHCSDAKNIEFYILPDRPSPVGVTFESDSLINPENLGKDKSELGEIRDLNAVTLQDIFQLEKDLECLKKYGIIDDEYIARMLLMSVQQIRNSLSAQEELLR